MADDQKAGSPFRWRNASAPPKRNARENDAALLALEARFDSIAAELDRAVARHHQDVDREALTKEIEATLARLDPIERAIMETPACTIVGLAVKARHAAYALSEYWEAPIDLLEWDARAARLLIEAVCDVARVSLNVRTERGEAK